MDPRMLLGFVVFVPVGAAGLTLALGRWLGRRSALAMLAAAVFSFVGALLLLREAAPVVLEVPWMPSLGVSLRLRADGFGLFFALLVSGIGTLVAAYSYSYIDDLGSRRLARYYAALTGFMASMLGIALADDLIILTVFWEATSVTSFLLIGFWYEQEGARKGANTALQVTALGGLVMLAGFLLVGGVTGTFTLSELAANESLRERLAASPVFVPALLLILVGAFTKSAQVPFHFWLPAAMVAPTPVSTYLHAATMVKAGIFLAGRMLPIFGAATIWAPILVPVGLATFFLGAYQAFREDDLKGLLARTTVSALGLVMMLYGLRSAEQDVLQILSHACYKGALFLVVGIVEHATGTRDLRRLGGLRRELPATFLVCLIAALSMAGLPPFLGFLAKESLYADLLATETLSGWTRIGVIFTAVAANALLFAAAARLVVGVFFGERPHDEHSVHGHHHGESAGLWLPPAVLAALALGLGLLGATAIPENLVNALSSDPHAHAHVSLVPAAAGPLLLSLLTIAGGTLLYLARGPVRIVQTAVAASRSMQDVWDALIAAITRFGTAFDHGFQNGSLRWYFSGILFFSAGVPLMALEIGGLSVKDATITLANLTWYGTILCALTAVSTLAVVRAATRLAAAIALTAVGFLVASLFVVYRSPDIVLTQILIETVSTIFILLVLYFMPPFRHDGMSPAETAWNLGVSVAVGLVAFVFLLLGTSPDFRETNNLAADYLSRTFRDAGGHNAVNVIIVDFRAMDTTGEITVLVVVGLCVYGILRARRQSA